MSTAPHVDLNHSDLSALDPTTTGIHADTNAFSNNTSSSSTSQQQGITKESLMNSAQSAMDAVANHPTTQNIKETVVNGPVGQNVKAETLKTRDEFADLANSRTTPSQPAATGQPLTHYHSLFYRLLSWRNPRATAISFAMSVIFILSARYLNVFRYILKFTFMILGTTAAAEVAGKMAFGTGFTSQVRPRKYFTIPKASLERLLDDVEQLINFFVIESQRIVFAENVNATGAAFFAALISYFLIQLVPFWGLALIATTVAYMGPLVYIKNKDVIDAHLRNASDVATQQATQIRDLAAQSTGNAAKTIQTYAGEYTHKAQETINQYRGRSASPDVKKNDIKHDISAASKQEFSPELNTQDFPAAPRQEFTSEFNTQDFPTAPRQEFPPVVPAHTLDTEKVPIQEPNLL